jgi:hypothetical protein
MVRRKEDVEEKIEYSIWCDPPHITDRDTTSSVRHREILLRLWYIKRISAFLTEQLVEVDFACRQIFIPGAQKGL